MPEEVYGDIKEFFLRWHRRLSKYSHEELLGRRYEKFRQMGQFKQV